jgi:AcrR family transcriptional regulator
MMRSSPPAIPWKVAGVDSKDHPPVPVMLTGPWRPNAALLLEEAIKLIDGGGERAVKVEPLAASLNMSVTMLYRYFGSRQGVVDAAQAERWMRSLSTSVGAACDFIDGAGSATEFRKRVNEVVVASLDRDRLEVLLRQVNVVGSAFGRPELMTYVTATHRHFNRNLVAIIDRAQQRGWVVRPADIETVTSWITSLAFGRVLALIDSDQAFDDDRWVTMTLETLNQALFAKPAPRLATLTPPATPAPETA